MTRFQKAVFFSKKRVLSAAVALAACSTVAVLITPAISLAEKVSRQVRSEATGRTLVYPNSVSSCSDPGGGFGVAVGVSVLNVTSELTYRVCREYRRFEIEVTGSGWNATQTEVPGTSQVTYQIEEVRDRSSRTLYNSDGIDITSWMLARSAVINECAAKKARAEMNAMQSASRTNPCAR